MPMGQYRNFNDCLSKNKGKDDPSAYCGYIKNQVEGKGKKKEECLMEGEHEAFHLEEEIRGYEEEPLANPVSPAKVRDIDGWEEQGKPEEESGLLSMGEGFAPHCPECGSLRIVKDSCLDCGWTRNKSEEEGFIDSAKNVVTAPFRNTIEEVGYDLDAIRGGQPESPAQPQQAQLPEIKSPSGADYDTGLYEEEAKILEEEISLMEEEEIGRKGRVPKGVRKIKQRMGDSWTPVPKGEAQAFIKNLDATIHDLETLVAAGNGYGDPTTIVSPTDSIYTIDVKKQKLSDVVVKQAGNGLAVEVDWYDSVLTELADIRNSTEKFMIESGWNNKDTVAEYKKSWKENNTLRKD